ncbi:MAG: MerR family transcriptional regulator [Clostridia bacterium]|nr:MerR family transcriptional regulator [Clostridia bacterium]
MTNKTQMLTVQQAARLSHVSIRTLHYYHQVGLLLPTAQTKSGYRMYDKNAMKRLQHILLFRKLKFSLKEIRQMLDDPFFNEQEALEKQIALLEMEKQHTQQLIDLANALRKGDKIMNFDAFDESEMEQFKQEARKKWGRTAAWQACEKKNPADMQNAGKDMMQLFADLGTLLHLSPAHPAVQQQVQQLQQYITAHFYPCTNEILSGLGQMYAQDERFRQNIDAHGGPGTAAFAAKAIEIFTKE